MNTPCYLPVIKKLANEYFTPVVGVCPVQHIADSVPMKGLFISFEEKILCPPTSKKIHSTSRFALFLKFVGVNEELG